MSPLLFILPFLVELGLLGFVIGTALRERSALARFVRASTDAERLKDVAMQLPGAYRAPATAFAGELARKAPLDEALTQALAKATNTHFGLAPLMRVLGGLGVAVLVLAPLAAGLWESAHGIDEALASTRAMSGSRVFLEARDHLEPAFDGLRTAFELSALLVAGLAVIVAAHWWLNRSEVREARFVKALIEAAVGARPNAAAPVSSRLSQLLAPERSLQLPVLAFAFFMLALCVGWSFLWATASTREANAASLYDVWPADARGALKSPAGMVVPSFAGGGAPVRERSLATLSVGPQRVDAAGDVLADLDARYALPEKFPQGANDVSKTIAGFKRQGTLDMNLLGHASVPMRTLLAVLDHLHTAGLRRVSCVLERAMSGTDREARVPAGLWLELSPPESVQPVLTLAIEPSSVVVDPAAGDALAVERDDPRWRQRLGEIVRARTGAKVAEGVAPIVAIRLAATELQYDRFLEILASADSTCTTSSDCGVPGLGLHFYLLR